MNFLAPSILLVSMLFFSNQAFSQNFKDVFKNLEPVPGKMACVVPSEFEDDEFLCIDADMKIDTVFRPHAQVVVNVDKFIGNKIQYLWLAIDVFSNGSYEKHYCYHLILNQDCKYIRPRLESAFEQSKSSKSSKSSESSE